MPEPSSSWSVPSATNTISSSAIRASRSSTRSRKPSRVLISSKRSSGLLQVRRLRILVSAISPRSRLRGFAIQARIYATGPGTITSYKEPSGPGVRVDSCGYLGLAPPPQFDPMFAKLICQSNSAGYVRFRCRPYVCGLSTNSTSRDCRTISPSLPPFYQIPHFEPAKRERPYSRENPDIASAAAGKVALGYAGASTTASRGPGWRKGRRSRGPRRRRRFACQGRR